MLLRELYAFYLEHRAAADRHLVFNGRLGACMAAATQQRAERPRAVGVPRSSSCGHLSTLWLCRENVAAAPPLSGWAGDVAGLLPEWGGLQAQRDMSTRRLFL